VKYRVLDEQKGRAAQYSARLLVMDPAQEAVEAAIRGYLWPDEWFTFRYDAVTDRALQMNKVKLYWQPRRMVNPHPGGVTWGLWWCGPLTITGEGNHGGLREQGLREQGLPEQGVPGRAMPEQGLDEHLWLCGLMVKRCTGVYPSTVYINQAPDGEAMVRGYERDEYLVLFESWAAVPVGYVLMV
jgi:hypothetical protein